MSIKEYLKGVKGFIFDYGGTIDSGGEHWSHLLRRGWECAGVDVDEALFREAYVYAERELARTPHILPTHNFSDLLQIKARLELEWLSERGELPHNEIATKSFIIANYCYEEAKRNVKNSAQVLDILSLRYPLVLVSNFYGNIETVLRDFGIYDYFKSIVESAVVGVRKPDPAIFRLGVNALGLSPEDCVVVGDSYRKDILPALEAGCRAVWLRGAGWDAAEQGLDYEGSIMSLSELI